MTRREGDQAIRRAFEKGFLELDEPSTHLEFRYRVWCEARQQPFVSLLRQDSHSVVELDLTRGPCQLTEAALLELSRILPYPFMECTQTRCKVKVPSEQAVSAAVTLFETAWRLSQE